MKLNKIYCDMDGVLADFNKEKDSLKRFDKENGFFKRLSPIRKNVKALKKLINKGYQVNILSASPNSQADKDKKLWLSKYLPELDNESIILCRLGEDKSKYVKDMSNSLLIDDYTDNLIKWVKSGGQGVKFLNRRYDKMVGKHTKYNIPYVTDIKELIK